MINLERQVKITGARQSEYLVRFKYRASVNHNTVTFSCPHTTILTLSVAGNCTTILTASVKTVINTTNYYS